MSQNYMWCLKTKLHQLTLQFHGITLVQSGCRDWCTMWKWLIIWYLSDISPSQGKIMRCVIGMMSASALWDIFSELFFISMHERETRVSSKENEKTQEWCIQSHPLSTHFVSSRKYIIAQRATKIIVFCI